MPVIFFVGWTIVVAVIVFLIGFCYGIKSEQAVSTKTRVGTPPDRGKAYTINLNNDGPILKAILKHAEIRFDTDRAGYYLYLDFRDLYQERDLDPLRKGLHRRTMDLGSPGKNSLGGGSDGNSI